MGELDPALAALENMNLDRQDRDDGVDFYAFGQMVDISLTQQNQHMTKNTAARQNLWQPEDERPKKKKKPVVYEVKDDLDDLEEIVDAPVQSDFVQPKQLYPSY